MMEGMSDIEGDVLAGVGSRLRALRRARSTTLAELAAETGLTASTLSLASPRSGFGGTSTV